MQQSVMYYGALSCRRGWTVVVSNVSVTMSENIGGLGLIVDPECYRVQPCYWRLPSVLCCNNACSNNNNYNNNNNNNNNAPLTPSLTRTSQTGRLHMVPCLPQTLCRPSSLFGINQAFCPPVLPWSQPFLTLARRPDSWRRRHLIVETGC